MTQIESIIPLVSGTVIGGSASAVFARWVIQKSLRDLDSIPILAQKLKDLECIPKKIDSLSQKMSDIKENLATISVKIASLEKDSEMLLEHDRKITSLEARRKIKY